MEAETILELEAPVVAADGSVYRARACGRRREDDGAWEGWIEFVSLDETTVWRTGRETTQPNRSDLLYWATGLSAVFLEGALARAMTPAPQIVVHTPEPPAFDGPAGDVDVVVEGPSLELPADPVLDPYVAYARGEPFLRRRLGALDAFHLRTIARAHRMVSAPAMLDRLAKPALIELIVEHVRVVANATAT